MTPGSLLVMRGDPAQSWMHWVPETAREAPERRNPTFRAVVKPIELP